MYPSSIALAPHSMISYLEGAICLSLPFLSFHEHSLDNGGQGGPQLAMETSRPSQSVFARTTWSRTPWKGLAESGLLFECLEQRP